MSNYWWANNAMNLWGKNSHSSLNSLMSSYNQMKLTSKSDIQAQLNALKKEESKATQSTNKTQDAVTYSSSFGALRTNDPGGELGAALTCARDMFSIQAGKMNAAADAIDDKISYVRNAEQEYERLLAGEFTADEQKWIDYAAQNHPEEDVAGALLDRAKDTVDSSYNELKEFVTGLAPSRSSGQTPESGATPAAKDSNIIKDECGDFSLAGLGLDNLDYNDLDAVSKSVKDAAVKTMDIYNNIESAYKDRFGVDMRPHDIPTIGFADKGNLKEFTMTKYTPGKFLLPPNLSTDPEKYFAMKNRSLDHIGKQND